MFSGVFVCPEVGGSSVSVQGGLCQGGVSVQGGLFQGDPLSPCGQTDTRENITLPQTSFAGGNY